MEDFKVESLNDEVEVPEESIKTKGNKAQCVDCGKYYLEKTLRYTHKHNCKGKQVNIEPIKKNEEAPKLVEEDKPRIPQRIQRFNERKIKMDSLFSQAL
jgi:hypothetical protein